MEAVYDLEIFPNYFLICLYFPEADEYREFDYYLHQPVDLEPLRKAWQEVTIVLGFNNHQYDNHLLECFLRTTDVAQVKKRSDSIIYSSGRGTRGHLSSFPHLQRDLDVMAIINGWGSLKRYQAQLGLDRIVECPIDFEDHIKTQKQRELVREYCRYDVYSTWKLYCHPSTQGELRAKERVSEIYQRDLTGESRSAIGAIVLSREIRRDMNMGSAPLKTRSDPQMEFTGSDLISSQLSFETVELNHLLDDLKDHYFKAPRLDFGRTVTVGDLSYGVGIGGLHSETRHLVATKLPDGAAIVEYDVSSYYPNMIINLSIGPRGYRTAFLEIYGKVLEGRLQAKARGDKARADCEKIILNSIFGKFGQSSSVFYCPFSMLQVTINCQLYLLQLIERVAAAEIEVVQANTDGIIFFPTTKKQQDRLDKIVKQWEVENRLEMDGTRYKSLVMANSNAYLAVGEKGEIKAKGKPFITERNLQQRWSYPAIIGRGVRNYFLKGISPDETIHQAEELRDFLIVAQRHQFVDGPPGFQTKINRWAWGREKNTLVSESRRGHRKRDDSDVILANDLHSVSWEDLDRTRYIQATWDEVRAIETGRTAHEIKRERERQSGRRDANQMMLFTRRRDDD